MVFVCEIHLLIARLEAGLSDVERTCDDEIQSNHLSEDLGTKGVPNEVNPQNKFQDPGEDANASDGQEIDG